MQQRGTHNAATVRETLTSVLTVKGPKWETTHMSRIGATAKWWDIYTRVRKLTLLRSHMLNDPAQTRNRIIWLYVKSKMNKNNVWFKTSDWWPPTGRRWVKSERATVRLSPRGAATERGDESRLRAQ